MLARPLWRRTATYTQTIYRTMASTTTNPTTETAAAAPPWHAAFPAPKSEVVTITREEVLGMLKGQTGEVAGKDFVLVDLRRNDFEVRLF